jgi:hypothetical protein
VLFVARGPRVSAGTRSSLRPLFETRAELIQSSGATCREIADSRLPLPDAQLCWWAGNFFLSHVDLAKAAPSSY